MKRANGTGVILVLVCLGVMLGLAALDWSFTWALSAGCVAMSLGDGLLRLRGEITGKERWLAGSQGGIFGRLPVWILGMLLLLVTQIGLIEWLNGQG